MSLASDERAMMDRTVIIEAPSVTDDDRYGNETTLWVVTQTPKGRLERLDPSSSGGEPYEAGLRDTGVVAWLIFVESDMRSGDAWVDVTIERTYRLGVDGRRFSISSVELMTGPDGSPHHYECICVEVT